MTSLLSILVAQLIWNVAAAVLLVRKPANSGAFSRQADRDAAMQVMT